VEQSATSGTDALLTDPARWSASAVEDDNRGFGGHTFTIIRFGIGRILRRVGVDDIARCIL